MEFFQKGLTPPDFWNFWDTFSRLLELLGHFLEKCPKSPLKKSFTQKVSQNFWIASEAIWYYTTRWEKSGKEKEEWETSHFLPSRAPSNHPCSLCWTY